MRGELEGKKPRITLWEALNASSRTLNITGQAMGATAESGAEGFGTVVTYKTWSSKFALT